MAIKKIPSAKRGFCFKSDYLHCFDPVANPQVSEQLLSRQVDAELGQVLLLEPSKQVDKAGCSVVTPGHVQLSLEGT